jgi:hypothetical protein
MDWIKRNLFFVIGGVVALALLGGAGYYSYTRYESYNAAREKLNADYDELKRLHNQTPSPGNEKVDNTKAAREQEAEVRALMAKAKQYFQPIPAVVNVISNASTGQWQVTGEDYAAGLRQVIDTLQKEATLGSVTLPPKYAFSFSAQQSLIRFAPGSLERLAEQLAEVRVIAGVLNKSKVNGIESIRRERVSTDDNSGPITDYLDRASVTNELAVITPYEVTFLCFSTELAGVISAMSASPHSLIVKGFNVEHTGGTGGVDPATGQPMSGEYAINPVPQPLYAPQQPAPLPTPQRNSGAEEAAVFARRYGKGGLTPTPTPAPQPVPGIVAPVVPKVQTILDEKQLRVTMLIYVVKLLPVTAKD